MEPVDNADTAAMALRVWQFRQGLMVSVMLNLGERLGLFAAMANRGSITSSDVADWCGYDERWCREWLRSMAAADIIESADGETFRLDGAAAAVLVSGSDHLLCASGALAPLPDPGVVDSIAAAFATGVGVPYDAHGSAGAHQIDAMLAPWARHGIIAELLPRIGDLVARLDAGCRVADVGCGAGALLFALAERFPNSSFVGCDPSHFALDLARRRLGDSGLENVTLHAWAAEELVGTFDLVMTFDCLHDMAFPGKAAAAVSTSLDGEGVWIIKEIRTSGDFATDRKNPLLAMLYATSVMTCMASGLSEEGGAGLGTLGLPEREIRSLVGSVGFTSVTTHDIGDPANLYYEVRR